MVRPWPASNRAKMGIPISVIDAFTTEKFRGNPAAVCVLAESAPDAWMQQVAAELNLSETAFLLPEADQWLLRWFTPTTEVALCGHATLASAHALWESGRSKVDRPIDFRTLKSGILTCRRDDAGVVMDFPVRQAAAASPPDGLQEALGCDLRWCGRSAYDLLVEVANEAVVRGLKPDFRALSELPVRGVIVTALASAGGSHDFVSRFFAPGAGVPEDPVTGSAHCTLAPYWATRLGRNRLRAWQVSARGGEVRTELAGDRVHLGGGAVTVWRGELA